jgi:hypothetical protein
MGEVMARSTTGWWENDGGKQWLMMGNSGLSGGLNYILYIYISGWWFFATPLKNHAVKVSWDDEIAIME